MAPTLLRGCMTDGFWAHGRNHSSKTRHQCERRGFSNLWAVCYGTMRILSSSISNFGEEPSKMNSEFVFAHAELLHPSHSENLLPSHWCPVQPSARVCCEFPYRAEARFRESSIMHDSNPRISQPGKKLLRSSA